MPDQSHEQTYFKKDALADKGYSMLKKLSDFSNSYPYLFFMVLVIVSHLPFHDVPITSDSYMHHVTIAGSDQLSEKGLAFTDPDTTFFEKIRDSFHFFNSETGTTESLRSYGNLPWWSSEDGRMQPFRPIAALTHWVDFHVLESNTKLMQLHNVAYFVVFSFLALFFYRKFSALRPIALISALLLVFDMSMSMNLGFYSSRNTYMALGLGLVSLYFYILWCEQNSAVHFVLALLVFAAALMTAEASVALSAYFGSYALVMDKRGWFKGLIATLPFAVTVIVWRVAYNEAGFGSEDIGLYIDPGRDIVEFVSHALLIYPLICFSMITAVDGIGGTVIPSALPWISLGFWVFLLIVLWISWPYIKNDKRRLMMLLGSLMAVVPHCALVTAGNRSGTFVAIGFFFLLAHFCYHLMVNGTHIIKKIIGYLTIGYHLVIPALIFACVSWGVIPVYPKDQGSYSSVEEHVESLEGKSLIIVNHFSTADLLVQPYQWDYQKKRVPDVIHAIAPGLSTFSLFRDSQNSLVVSSQTNIVLTPSSPMLTLEGGRPLHSKYYGYRTLQGLVTPKVRQYEVGEIIQRNGMTIEILETKQNEVMSYKVSFKESLSEGNLVWQWFDWNGKVFNVMKPLEVGEERVFYGPLDI